MPITDENISNLKSDYKARREGELPVLTRFLEMDAKDVPVADYLVLVLYSKEQIEKEASSSIEKSNGKIEKFDGDWGIVNIMAQMKASPEPMTPITMMRNSLGIEEGGSGVSLNKYEYNQSVYFWSKNALVKVKK